jgi:hypothetical protein
MLAFAHCSLHPKCAKALDLGRPEPCCAARLTTAERLQSLRQARERYSPTRGKCGVRARGEGDWLSARFNESLVNLGATPTRRARSAAGVAIRRGAAWRPPNRYPTAADRPPPPTAGTVTPDEFRHILKTFGETMEEVLFSSPPSAVLPPAPVLG